MDEKSNTDCGTNQEELTACNSSLAQLSLNLEGCYNKSGQLQSEVTEYQTSNDNLKSEVKKYQVSNDKLQLKLAKYKYQYMSEQKSWTDRKTNISSKQETLSIKVLAKELPWKNEFAAEVVVGERKTIPGVDAERVKIKLWNGNGTVFYSIGSFKEEIEIDDDSQLETVEIRIPNFIVITSNGIGVEKQGASLGVYIFNSTLDYYIQTNTEQTRTSRYLYKNINGAWTVGRNPGTTWFWNKQTSETVPTSGWEVADNNNAGWQADPNLTITAGPLTDICKNVTISASGSAKLQPSKSRLGVFTRTEKWYNSRPVYINNFGNHLYVTDDGFWSIGQVIGVYVLRSTGAPLHVVDATNWVYNGRKPDLSITCNK